MLIRNQKGTIIEANYPVDAGTQYVQFLHVIIEKRDFQIEIKTAYIIRNRMQRQDTVFGDTISMTDKKSWVFLRKIMVVFGNETWVLEKRWPWLVYTPPSFLVDWRSPCWIIDDWTVQSNPICDWASVESVWERSVWSDSLFDFLMKRVRVTEKLEVGYGA